MSAPFTSWHNYRCTIPELNSEMDVYRIGTLLEMVREMAYQLAVDGKLVKVCVQQSMGQGVFQVCLLMVCLTVLPRVHCRVHSTRSPQQTRARHGTAQHSAAQLTAQHTARECPGHLLTVHLDLSMLSATSSRLCLPHVTVCIVHRCPAVQTNIHAQVLRF